MKPAGSCEPFCLPEAKNSQSGILYYFFFKFLRLEIHQILITLKVALYNPSILFEAKEKVILENIHVKSGLGHILNSYNQDQTKGV